jgi:multidrug efflux pump subunit AcrB
LTLTPVACANLLKRHAAHERSLYARTEPYFASLTEWYRRTLQYWLDNPWVSYLVFAVSFAAIAGFYLSLPRELAPYEDRSRFSVNVTGPEGSSHEYTLAAMDRVTAAIEEGVPERSALITMTGMGATNSAFARVFLSPPAERKRLQAQIVQELSGRLRSEGDVRAIATQEPTIGDRRGGLPVQYVIMAPSLDALREKVPAILAEVAQDPAIQVADVNMKFSKPQLQLRIDRQRAQDLGVSVLDIAQSLQLAYSGSRYGWYTREGKQYPVVGQYYRADRSRPLDLAAFSVRNREGQFVTLDNFVSWSEESSPPQLYRYNRMASATISAGLAPGRTIADGIEAADRAARKHLEPGYGTALAGASRDFAESSSNLLVTFLGTLVLIYLVLAAQFESWRHPFTVMLTVPLAVAGALFSLWYLGQSLNVFSQIGLIMLVGLVTKNGILIVEFANQRRAAGLSMREAVIAASVSRFRPILMTSLTSALGSLPIALAMGASAQSRMSMGTVVIGGVVFSLVLSLLVVPVMYTLVTGRGVDATQPAGEVS